MENNYRSVIIERFIDDCRTYTIKDKNQNTIERCSTDGSSLFVFYENKESFLTPDLDKAIQFIMNCTLEDE